MAPIRCCFDQTAVWHSDAARGPSTPSFDHLVGAGEHARWQLKADRLGGLQIDHQLELGWRLHRKVGRLLAPEDAVDVTGRASELVDGIRSIGNQAAGGGEVGEWVNRTQLVARRKHDDQLAVNHRRRGPRHDQAAVRLARECRDAVALRASQLARGAAGEAFFTERGKTGKPVGGILSTRALWGLHGYLEKLGVELHGDAYIFRNRSGARYSVDTLGDDFRDVRSIEFGPLERRTIGHDFRRTGAVEAITGGAKVEQLAHAMGNTLSASNALFATYVPVNVTTLREVMDARRRGRSKLR